MNLLNHPGTRSTARLINGRLARGARSLARSLSVKVSGQSYCKTSCSHRNYAELSGKRASASYVITTHLAWKAAISHLADLVKGVLPVSASVLEVVVSWERPVDVPGDGAVLRGLLSRHTTGSEDWELNSEQVLQFEPLLRSTRTRTISRNQRQPAHRLLRWYRSVISDWEADWCRDRDKHTLFIRNKHTRLL